MSGHNKWSTIKHKKGALDAKRGKLFTKLARDITMAARGPAGGDPSMNAALAIVRALLVLVLVLRLLPVRPRRSRGGSFSSTARTAAIRSSPWPWDSR